MFFRVFQGWRNHGSIQGAHLSWGDISVDNLDTPTLRRVILKRSKTDQFGRGAEVYSIGKTVCSLCPVAAVLSYMCSRGASPGPFFTFKDGRPLTKPLFTKHVRTVLQEIGLPYNDFSGHSFRIGAATAAAKVGIEDSTIRILGCWNSSSFLAYIRSPPEQLAHVSRSLAKL